MAHMTAMNENSTHPYSLAVTPSVRKPGTFDWAIRKNGALLERSDRAHRTEDDARRSGDKAIERLISPGPRDR